MFKLAKDSAVKACTQAINQLKAVLVIADPAPRERWSSLGNAELFRTCARLSLGDGDDEDQTTHISLSLLALDPRTQAYYERRTQVGRRPDLHPVGALTGLRALPEG
jgi:hypothetical protein